MTSAAATDLDIRVLALDAPADRDLVAQWVRVRADSARHDLGRYASPFALEEYLAFSRYEAYRRHLYAVVLGERVVAAGAVTMPQRDNITTASLILDVDPAHRRRGVGSGLLTRLESTAAEQGRTSLMAETAWSADSDDGCGTGFLGPRGYEHALTSIQSDLLLADLPDGDLAQQTVAEDGYVVEWCVGALPDAWLEDVAMMATRMSTDAPTGGLDLTEETWDADRVRASIEVDLSAGRTLVMSVARNLGSGHLAGYSVLTVSPDSPDLAYQNDTLVLREHRGHGLGRRMKTVTGAVLRLESPDVGTVRTWNADTNTHMLAVNVEMGFRPVAYEAEWQKRVRAGSPRAAAGR